MSIFPSWVENRLFPCLESGFVRLKLLSLKGNIEQLKNLHLPQNQSAFTARLACKNFKVLGLGFKQPFKETSADVTLEKGSLLISDLRARFGRSKIKGASLNIRGLYSNRPSYEILMAGSFELQDLIQQLEMNFIPQGIRKKLGSMATLSGKLECRTKVLYKSGSE